MLLSIYKNPSKQRPSAATVPATPQERIILQRQEIFLSGRKDRQQADAVIADLAQQYAASLAKAQQDNAEIQQRTMTAIANQNSLINRLMDIKDAQAAEEATLLRGLDAVEVTTAESPSIAASVVTAADLTIVTAVSSPLVVSPIGRRTLTDDMEAAGVPAEILQMNKSDLKKELSASFLRTLDENALHEVFQICETNKLFDAGGLTKKVLHAFVKFVDAEETGVLSMQRGELVEVLREYYA